MAHKLAGSSGKQDLRYKLADGFEGVEQRTVCGIKRTIIMYQPAMAVVCWSREDSSVHKSSVHEVDPIQQVFAFVEVGRVVEYSEGCPVDRGTCIDL